jgi:hypothetical protein
MSNSIREVTCLYTVNEDFNHGRCRGCELVCTRSAFIIYERLYNSCYVNLNLIGEVVKET